MLKRSLVLLSLLYLLAGSGLTAQVNNTSDKKYIPPLSERILYGGNFSLQLGNYTYIEVSPVIGLWLLPRLSVAAGPSYRYIRDPGSSTDVFGAKSYARFNIIQDLDRLIPLGLRMAIFVHGEYEMMSYRSDYFYSTYENERFRHDLILAGFGISEYIGLKSSADISVLWILNESEIQIYDSPLLRFGFTF